METTIIVLAAGNSSRLGRSKQLLTVNHKSFIAHATETAIRVANARVVVVLGANETEHKSVIGEFPVNIISNSEWSKGMGSSLKLGLQYAKEKLRSTQVIFMVCDQPYVTSQHLSNLIALQKATGKNIVTSLYQNTAGVPVLFTEKYFSELLTIQDQEGAKKIISTHSEDVETIPFPAGEIDIDTIEDYEAFLRKMK